MELVDGVQGVSVTGRILGQVMTRVWSRVKYNAVLGMLEGDKDLQKTVLMMIKKEELESRRVAEEARRTLRLDRKREKEQM